MMYRFLSALLLLSATAWSADPRPNIVFLLADDLGWADVSPGPTNNGQGSRYHDTPNITELTKQGTSFRRAYVQQNCAPTRAALLTGEYPARPGNGVFNVGSLARGAADSIIVPPAQNGSIPDSSVTLPKVLAQAGYLTAFFGKDHGFKASTAGFEIDRNCGKKAKSGKKVVRQYFPAEKDGKWHFASPAYDKYAEPYTADYVAKNLQPFANGNDPAALVGTPKHLTDAMADAAIDFIREQADGDRPFYMNVSFQAVHAPIVARPDLVKKYDKAHGKDPRHDDAKYAALVQGLDEAVGRIVRALDDPNGDGDTSDSIADKTLVVFLSDNGGYGGQTSNAPLRGAKGMFYEGGIRIPLALRLPGVIKAGGVTDEPVHAVDLYPTLAAFAGAPLPPPEEHPVDGVSFAELARGKKDTLERDALYWHFPGYMDTRQVPNSVIAKRVGGRWWKLFYYYEGQVYELYDLTNDERERHNLLASDPGPEMVALAEDLRNDLCQWLEETQAPLGTVRQTAQPVNPPIPVAESLKPRMTAIDGSPMTALHYPEIGKDGDD